MHGVLMLLVHYMKIEEIQCEFSQDVRWESFHACLGQQFIRMKHVGCWCSYTKF